MIAAKQDKLIVNFNWDNWLKTSGGVNVKGFRSRGFSFLLMNEKAFGEGGQPKAAVTLRMIDKLPKDFFSEVGPKANYYRQIIGMCEEVISGVSDLTHLEETLRRFYMQTGWQLYTIDKLLSAIIRFIMNIVGSDSKDKSLDIINLFNKDREKAATSRAQELQYRKQVEKYATE